MSRPRTAAVLLAVAVTAVLPGCGPATPPPAAPASSVVAEPIRIATGPTGQTAVLAHVYAGRLREAGFDASVVDAGTDRDAYLGALERGEAELVADHSGNLYLHLRGLEPAGPATPAPTGTSTPTPTSTSGGLAEDLSALLGLDGEGADDDDVLAGVREVLPEELRILEPAPAENTVAVVVTRVTAVEHGLEDLEDLGRFCGRIVLGADPDFAGRPYGTEGLADAYGCVPEDVVAFVSPEELVTALLEDEVQAAALFTASPEIEDNSLVVLADPLNNFVPQRVVPVGARDLPEAAADVVDEVSSGIGTEDLVLMARMTSSRGAYTPKEAARYWLEGDDDS